MIILKACLTKTKVMISIKKVLIIFKDVIFSFYLLEKVKLLGMITQL